jgi:putative ABC transport system permease protein
MLRNWLATLVGNFARSWLYAGVTVVGLALAFSAAIVIALFVRHETSYERFIPGHQHVYRVMQWMQLGGREPEQLELSGVNWASQIEAAEPRIKAARLIQEDPILRSHPGDQGVRDPGFAFADPEFFRVFPLEALAGDPLTALQQPGTVVLTRSAARRYFGRDIPMGATLEISLLRRGFNGVVLPEEPGDRRTFRVTAVIEDLPSTTHLATQVFASSRGVFNHQGRVGGPGAGGPTSFVLTYLRAAPDTRRSTVGAALARVAAPLQAGMPKGDRLELRALPITGIRFGPPSVLPDAKPTSDPRVLAAIAVVGMLIVVIASTNFVTLMTARAGRRAVEVAVRKASGASRRSLVWQFLGEALVYVALAMILGAALAEVLLPTVNAAIERQLEFNYFGDPAVVLAIMAVTLVLGLLAGLYPAFVLSAFRPSTVLKGGLGSGGGGSVLIRQGLVLLQFAILILLIVATATVYRQTDYALSRSLNTAGDPILTVRSNCNTGFTHAVRQLPGVQAASCASLAALNLFPKGLIALQDREGRVVPTALAAIDPGFFDVFGIEPLAGRVFSFNRPADSILNLGQGAERLNVVLNEAAARSLGYSSPSRAVGQSLRIPSLVLGPTAMTLDIIGIVPDQPESMRSESFAELYYVGDRNWGMVAARTSTAALPETREAVRRLWRQFGDPGMIQDGLMSQLQRRRYQDIITQGTVIAAGAGLALFIACLGLFALSAFTAEQRIKEIGVRKAMGAGTGSIMRLLLWQFTKPVLLANLVAWPLAWWAMSRWLEGFVYRVDLPLWLFGVATVATLLIAWITTSAHALRVAGAKPVEALRYE